MDAHKSASSSSAEATAANIVAVRTLGPDASSGALFLLELEYVPDTGSIIKWTTILYSYQVRVTVTVNRVYYIYMLE